MDKQRDTEINKELTMVKLPDGRIVNMDFQAFKDNVNSDEMLDEMPTFNQELK